MESEADSRSKSGSSFSGKSDRPWQPPTVEELQGLLPQYEIESLIGRGGMGAVYRGKQAALDRPVAIKLLPENLAEDDSGGNFVERFKLEARSMANLDHPAIISVHDFGQTSEGHLYFVMEFIDGMDMHKYIQLSGGSVEPDTAVAIVSHVLDALDYAHSKGIVHRDIKPANVLINRDGKVKIADFGLAKKLTGDDEPAVTGLTMSNVALGTPDFVAPEALDPDATPDHRADLYAVGIMLYQMLTGKTPRGIFKLPSEENDEIDPRLDDILTLAMEADPGGRFQSATEFRLKLDELASAPVEKIEPELPSEVVEAPAEQLDFTEPGLRKSESVRRHSPTAKRKNGAGPIVWTVLASLLVGGVIFFLIAGSGEEDGTTGLLVAPDPVQLEQPSKPDEKTTVAGNETEVPAVANEDEDMGSSPASSVSEKPSADSKVTDVNATPFVGDEGKVEPYDLAADGEWHDVLSEIAESPNVSEGDWNFDGQRLSISVVGSNGKGDAVLGIDAKPMSNFEAKVRFTSQAREKEVALSMILPTPLQGSSVFIYDGTKRCGIEKSPNLTPPILPGGSAPISHKIGDGEIHEWFVSVKGEEVKLHLDGKLQHQLTIPDWAVANQSFVHSRSSPILGLRAEHTDTVFHSFEIRVPQSETTPMSKAEPVDSTPASSSPKKVIPELLVAITAHQTDRQTQLSALLAKYQSALTRAEEAAIGAGALAQVEAVQTAIQRASSFSDLIVALPKQEKIEPLSSLPPLGSEAPAELKRLRGIFDAEVPKIESRLLAYFKQTLEALQTDLVKAKRIDDARAVKEWRSAQVGGVYFGPSAGSAESGVESEWTELFNGRDLSGWSVKGGFGEFKVEGGEIVGEIKPGSPATFLCTDAVFGDFELEYEAKLGGTTNSGVQIRSKLKDASKNAYGGIVMGPQIELEQSPGESGYIYGEQTGTGWLSDSSKEHSYLNNSAFNHFRVVAEGPRIRTWLNGNVIEDLARADLYSQFPIGFVALQLHKLRPGSGDQPVEIRWRDFRIRPLNDESDKTADEGGSVATSTTPNEWADNFSEANLKGWKTAGDPNAFRLEGGALKAGVQSRPSLLLWTGDESSPKAVKNFEMTFRARSEGPMANSGIYYHINPSLQITEKKWPEQGQEIQLVVNATKEVHRTAGIYNLVAPEFTVQGTDRWKDYRIRVEGDRVQAWVDGRQALDYTESADLPSASAHQQNRISPVGGAIAIQANSRNGAWYFDDVKIRTW